MTLVKDFRQSQYILSTGNQIPLGICLGLVVNWLISISKGITGDEAQFWKDANDIYNGERAALLGKGYGRKALSFQDEYIKSNDITRTYMQENGLNYEKNQSKDHVGAFDDTLDIAKYALNAEYRYLIVYIYDESAGHAIGLYRKMTPFVKSNNISIFDPNFGKFDCNGQVEIQQDLLKIGNLYKNKLNIYYKIEEYK